jgi:hypothetical protein
MKINYAPRVKTKKNIFNLVSCMQSIVKFFFFILLLLFKTFNSL